MRLAAPTIIFALFTTAPLMAQYCATVDDQPNANAGLTYSELAHKVMSVTAPQNLDKLAPGDKEFILNCGSPEEAKRVFAVIGNTPVELPGALVIAANQNSISVAISDCAIWTRTPDYLFKTSAPLTTVPNPGTWITIGGIYASYARQPFLINMTNSYIKPYVGVAPGFTTPPVCGPSRK